MGGSAEGRGAKPREKLHPLIRSAGKKKGELPAWAVLGKARRAHVGRVSVLMGDWAAALGLDKTDRTRWRAAGLLHDALKDAKPAVLQPLVDDGIEWPDPVVHGPACAVRLRQEGVEDEAILMAIAHHTTGHPELDRLGESLYLADYLEPGRRSRAKWRTALRRGMPGDHDEALVDVAAAKISALLKRRLPILPMTVEFWAEVQSRI